MISEAPSSLRRLVLRTRPATLSTLISAVTPTISLEDVSYPTSSTQMQTTILDDARLPVKARVRSSPERNINRNVTAEAHLRLIRPRQPRFSAITLAPVMPHRIAEGPVDISTSTTTQPATRPVVAEEPRRHLLHPALSSFRLLGSSPTLAAIQRVHKDEHSVLFRTLRALRALRSPLKPVPQRVKLIHIWVWSIQGNVTAIIHLAQAPSWPLAQHRQQMAAIWCAMATKQNIVEGQIVSTLIN